MFLAILELGCVKLKPVVSPIFIFTYSFPIIDLSRVLLSSIAVTNIKWCSKAAIYLIL